MRDPIDNGGPPITDEAPRLRVARIHLNDWVASTRGMSLDEEGFFWRFTVLFYDRMGDLPDNDATNARAMNLDVRRFKFMKARLIELGKISVAGGRLTNARAEREIANYVAEFKKRSEAAKAREAGKRFQAETDTQKPEIGTDFAPTSVSTSPRYRADIASKSDRLRPDTNPDLSEKDNEIKGSTATTLPEGDHSPRGRARPKPKPKPLSEERPPYAPHGGADPLDQAFEDFWRAFPEGRKQAKGEARDTFRKIVLGRHRKGLRAKAETLIAAAARYAASKPDPDFTPMPTTWLNGGRWEDVPAGPPTPAPGDPEPVAGKSWGWWRGLESKFAALGEQRWRDAIDKAKPNGTWPWWILGAPPGHAECVVPPELVREFGFEEIYRGSIHHV